MRSSSSVRPAHMLIVRILGAAAILFGLATIRAGGGALFGDAAERAAAGAYVPFVLWFNALAGFAYVAAGIGLLVLKRWAAHLAVGLAFATAAVFAAFGLHVALGGAFEMRTVGALAIRTVFWALVGLLAWRVVTADMRGGRAAL